MSDSSAEIESLNGLDTAMLNNQGWHLVTHFRVREGTDGSKAYNYAVDKVQNHNRHAGIRTIIRGGVTYHEIWDFWK
ncbi:MAG: hypothetical protein GKR92_08860 [Gammaproteobacteria bacterium]|nr:MAG: hypothetical protein GKR92_08860 [Gammaproteobacteria bacterium]